MLGLWTPGHHDPPFLTPLAPSTGFCFTVVKSYLPCISPSKEASRPALNCWRVRPPEQVPGSQELLPYSSLCPALSHPRDRG